MANPDTIERFNGLIKAQDKIIGQLSELQNILISERKYEQAQNISSLITQSTSIANNLRSFLWDYKGVDSGLSFRLGIMGIVKRLRRRV